MCVCGAACLALVVAPESFGMAPSVGQAAGLTAGALAFWATRAIPEYLTALGVFLAAILVEAASPSVIFAGFASTAFWLVFAGMVLAGAVDRTGLGRRLAAAMTKRVDGSYARIIAATVLVATGLSFLLPSTMGRVLLLLPIVIALADRIGFGPGSRGRTGMVLAALLGSYLMAAGILPGNVANMVMAGAAETLYGLDLRYGPYLVLHFPVLGVLKAIVLIGSICWLFPDRPGQSAHAPSPAPLTPESRRLAVVLAATLVVWATDSIHGISPAWVGLAAAILCLVPGIRLLPPDDVAARVTVQPLIYVAGVLGIAALIDDSGLGAELSRSLLGWLDLQSGADAMNYLKLTALATGLGLVTTIPGMPAVFTPLSGDIAALTGWPLEAAVMIQVVGFSTPVLPYQLPPLMVGMALAGIGLGEGTRLTLLTAALTLIVLVPANFFWWRAMTAFTEWP